jgi:UDP-glucose 4-epimerase
MKILLTGASGLLGRSLTPLLLQFSKVYSLGRNQIPGCEIINSTDLSVDWNINHLPDKIDAVIHLAQFPKYKDFPNSAIKLFNTNLRTTAILLDYAKKAGAKRFILTSTGGVYRSSQTTIMEESDLVAPSDLGYYFATKLSSEMIAANYRTIFDVNILRIFFMYGPNQRNDSFIETLYNKIMNNETIYLNGKDGIRVNPVHVEDVADAIVNIIKHGGPKTINAAGESVVSIREICEIIGQRVNKLPVFEIKSPQSDLISGNKIFLSVLNNKLREFNISYLGKN